ncbi:MAG: complex I NDUFA9 subunit family protein [Rhodocyclaceae bacterium]|nr:complex I NDUFA9 subunit family protein [Rhodocyclaceae bacterium]MBX3669925.1 complex I NDUFA9 subunit family protein [Rhodocyclaceae bacterium]
MAARKYLVVGGAGFIGTQVASRLVARGDAVIVPSRKLEAGKHITMLPTARLEVCDVAKPGVLEALMAGCDAVINLVGVLQSPPGAPFGTAFAHAHVELPRRIVAAAQASGLKRVLHVSALGAERDAPSQYLRSKAYGEAVYTDAYPAVDYTIFRPSVVFGPKDNFLNMFARLVDLFPVLPLAGARARFQPVYVRDVAAAIVQAIDMPDTVGKAYPLCGPTVYALRDLVSYVATLRRRTRVIIELGPALSYLQALALEMAPGEPLMSRDNLRSMEVDNITLAKPLPFGMTPTALESVAPGYLAR